MQVKQNDTITLALFHLLLPISLLEILFMDFLTDQVLGFRPTVSLGMEVALALSPPGTAGVAAVELAQAELLPHRPQTANHHYHTP